MRHARQDVLNAAMQLFAEKGYAATSIREICHAAGVTKPVLYYHFGGKDHLYRELMIDSFGQFSKLLLAAAQHKGSLRDRLLRLVQADFKASRENPVRLQFMLRMAFSPEGQNPEYDFIREMEHQRQVIARILQEGIDGGEIGGNTRLLATALMGMQLIATLENVFTRRRTLTRRHAEQHVDLLLNGCRKNKGE